MTMFTTSPPGRAWGRCGGRRRVLHDLVERVADDPGRIGAVPGLHHEHPRQELPVEALTADHGVVDRQLGKQALEGLVVGGNGRSDSERAHAVAH
jgi:hypothetical protein